MSLPRVCSPFGAQQYLRVLPQPLVPAGRSSWCRVLPLLLRPLGGGLLGPAEFRAVGPHAVQDGGQLAGQGNAGLLGADLVDQPRRPGLGRRPILHPAQEAVRRPGGRGAPPNTKYGDTPWPRRACAGPGRRHAWSCDPTSPPRPIGGVSGSAPGRRPPRRRSWNGASRSSPIPSPSAAAAAARANGAAETASSAASASWNP